MEDALFVGLQQGVLVHRLYLMTGTEILNTSPATWKVTAINDDYIELLDVTVQQALPYMVSHLAPCTVPHYTTTLRVRKAVVVGIEYVIAYPTNTP